MRLLVDAGNTRLKWRMGDGVTASLLHGGASFDLLLDRAWGGLERPSAVVVASVTGARVREALQARSEALWPGVQVHFLSSRKACCGVRLAYPEPERFGIDRLAALVAGHARSTGRPLVIVDAGTAVTVDAMDGRGNHRGGLIMPGRRLLSESLVKGAEALGPYVQEAGMSRSGPLQDNTEDAVAAGVECMLVGGVERAIREVRAMLGPDASLLITGGDGEVVSHALGEGQAWTPDLVLDGVALMASAGMSGCQQG
ncbi:MAG: type III pantothenate kinase [Halothiobacillaceae bacterium]|jgi:type III pantothenate kinase|nr:MAG: type III pantothenate kinase [Halothiobacillaceae bacterium]